VHPTYKKTSRKIGLFVLSHYATVGIRKPQPKGPEVLDFPQPFRELRDSGENWRECDCACHRGYFCTNKPCCRECRWCGKNVAGDMRKHVHERHAKEEECEKIEHQQKIKKTILELPKRPCPVCGKKIRSYHPDDAILRNGIFLHLECFWSKHDR
jgi:hypothetical protein